MTDIYDPNHPQAPETQTRNLPLQDFDPYNPDHDLKYFIEELPPEYYDRLAKTACDMIDRQAEYYDPKPLFDDMATILITLMRDSLDYNPQTEDDQPDLTQGLRHQANAMDLAFRRLLHGADTLYKNSDKTDCDPMKYVAAFKAQEQYRQTVKTLHAIKMDENAPQKVKKWRQKRSPKNLNTLE